MTSKRILVGVGGVKLSNDGDLERFLQKKNAACLIDSDGYAVYGFGALEEGGEYTLGPPPQLEHHQLSAETWDGIAAMENDYTARNRTIVLSDATSSGKDELLEMLDLPVIGTSWPNKPAILSLEE